MGMEFGMERFNELLEGGTDETLWNYLKGSQ